MIEFYDPKEAFDDAILLGVLSESPKDTMFAGQFMYMGTRPANAVTSHPVHTFKNVSTREYVECSHECARKRSEHQ